MSEIALARALGIPAEAISAARALARSLALHGEHERARRILEGCLALDAGDLESALELAELAIARADPSAALDAAGRALAAAGGELRSCEAALLFARALLLAGEIDEARGWLTRIARRSDAPVIAKTLLARLPRHVAQPRPDR